MHTPTKLLSIILSVSLFAQNALFAMPQAPQNPGQHDNYGLISDYSAPQTQAASPSIYQPQDTFSQTQAQPLTLAQYQQRARQDAAKAPWITREGKMLLAVGGTAVGLLLVQQIRHKSQINQLHAMYHSSLRAAHRNSNEVLKNAQDEHLAQKEQWLKNTEEQRRDWHEKMTAEREQWARQEELLRKQLSEEQAARQSLEKQLKLSQKKTAGLSVSVQKQRTKVENLITRSVEREKELQAQIGRLGEQLTLSQERLMQWTYYRNVSIETEMKAYLDLFNKNISRQERAALRKMLENEAWVKALPAHHQKDFLRIIDKGMQVSETGTASSSALIEVMTREAVDKALPTYERLVFLVRKLARPGNLATVALIVTLGLTSYDARSQKLGDRLNANFNLFLEATPQQLSEMESDDNLRKICISGAQALHELTLLSPQETAAIQNILRQNSPGRQSPVLGGQTAR